jgi:hypothetical protein
MMKLQHWSGAEMRKAVVRLLHYTPLPVCRMERSAMLPCVPSASDSKVSTCPQDSLSMLQLQNFNFFTVHIFLFNAVPVIFKFLHTTHMLRGNLLPCQQCLSFDFKQWLFMFVPLS